MIQLAMLVLLMPLTANIKYNVSVAIEFVEKAGKYNSSLITRKVAGVIH